MQKQLHSHLSIMQNYTKIALRTNHSETIRLKYFVCAELKTTATGCAKKWGWNTMTA
ncbi:hypothetical protein SAMN05444280_101130 [Tangfeifania diversioriginum]|uniref:Uncharacterized protein n=1 Tax=Tangfeifania diversioriginum TaxID=1168035 RepID=A0A1M6AAD1_9BACT|nr:hypothetical protein SAMN05444280_101130 [Tangfeifania diversioriginum]